MTWWQSTLFGIIQGITEFIPVSSSTHVILLARLLGLPDPGATYNSIIQIGSELAVIFYFRTYISRLLRTLLPQKLKYANVDTEDRKLLFYLVLATIPIVLAGFFFADFIESQVRSLLIAAIALLVGGVFLLFAEFMYSRPNNSGQCKLTLPKTVGIGLAQILALIPGASRSGVTITSGLLLGLTRYTAVTFSFLLGIPTILGAALFQIFSVQNEGTQVSIEFIDILLGVVTSFVIGYYAISYIMRWVQTRSLAPFAIYRIILAVTIIWFLL